MLDYACNADADVILLTVFSTVTTENLHSEYDFETGDEDAE